MIAPAQSSSEVPGGARSAGTALQTGAMIALLVCVGARCFLVELPFRTSAVRGVLTSSGPGAGTPPAPSEDRGELSRLTFAVLLLTVGAVWLVGAALIGGPVIRHRYLALLIALFAVWSLISALCASDRRAGLNVWIEQLSLLTAGWFAAQMFASRRRFALLVVVLAGLGGAMAIKGGWQVAVEVPERIRDFEMYRAERLGQLGWAEGTPQATLLESRMRDSAPFGFFALANLFASLMIVLTAAAVALAADKIIVAVRAMRARPVARKGGEIDIPLLAGIITAAMALGAVVVLLLTRSRGGIGGATVAGVIGVAVWKFRKPLGRRWRMCVLVASCVSLLGAATVVGYGLLRDRLPTKTMTFRWYYWTASGEMVRENPVLGVGPGNFASAYLHHRRAAAEEEVKMPHNVVVHAAAQYGLPGAALYLGILGYVLIGATRPASRQTDQTVEEAPRRGREWIAPGIVVAGMLVGRWVFADLTGPALLLFDGILPAVVLGACLLVAGWCSSGAVSGPRSVVRMVLVVGLFGILLHNMVTFSLWTPGVGLLFWTVAGACLAQAGGRSKRTRKLVGALVAIAAVVAVGVVSVLFFGCAFVRMRHTTSMLDGLRRGEIQRAVTAAAHAANADLWDSLAAADAAKVARLFAVAPSAGRTEQTSYLSLAYNWAAASVARDPANSARHRLAANLAAEFARLGLPAEPTMGDALDHMMRAVDLNPNDARLRIAYARMLLSAGRGGECAAQLDAAERVESQLLPGSIEKLKPLERREIEALRGEARAQ